MCNCESKERIFEPFYANAVFANGDICNGLVTDRNDEMFFHAVDQTGKETLRNELPLHVSGEEKEFQELCLPKKEEEAVLVLPKPSRPATPALRACQNCPGYKYESELKQYGALLVCSSCRTKLEGSRLKKAQMSFFDDQPVLF